MPKNVLCPVRAIEAQAMNTDITSAAVVVQYVDNITVQANAISTNTQATNPTGTLTLQGSLDYSEYFGEVTNPGNWVTLATFAAYTDVSNGGIEQKSISATGMSAIRLSYTNTFTEYLTVGLIANTAARLNNKYFLINAADGVNYYVWYNSDGTGVDPLIPNRTGVEVDIQTGDTATDVATNTKDAIDSDANASFSTHQSDATSVTIINLVAGHGSYANGSPSTGFSFDYTESEGVLDVYVSAKAV